MYSLQPTMDSSDSHRDLFWFDTDILSPVRLPKFLN